MYHNRSLRIIPLREAIDRHAILVALQRPFVLQHGVSILEQGRRSRSAGVENHGRDARWDLVVGVRAGFLVVAVYCARGGVVHVVEEDARDGDVGCGVRGPFGVEVDLGRQCCVGGARVVGVDVAEGERVGVAVDFRDRGYVVCVWGVGSGPGVRVDDDLPVYFWVCCDGGGYVGPG